MPAAPRTITIPVLLVCTIISQLFFSSCVDKIKTDIVAFRALDEGLVSSNVVINKNTQTIVTALADKISDPKTSERAKVWYPKAKLIEKISASIYNYIDSLKVAVKNEADMKTENGVESFKENDKNSVMRLFNKQGKAEELHERLNNYKKEVLAVDPELDKAFSKSMLLATPAFDANTEKQDFNRIFFDDIPSIAALAMLSKFQNNIRVNENGLASFCYSQTGHTDGSLFSTQYSPITLISSSYVKAGQEIEIISGIGGFNTNVLPEVKIDNKNVSIDKDGAAHYKFKASDKPGKHTVPVELGFTEVDGNKKTILKTVEYTVAQ